MELPTVEALQQILDILEELPDSDEDKAEAIAKVQRQMAELKADNG